MLVPTVTFEDREVAAGKADSATVDRICAAFGEHGAVRLLNVFDPRFREELREHYLSRYRFELSGTVKEDRRPLYTVDVQGPVARPTYFANPLLHPFLTRVLGPDFVIGAVSTVISFPGAPEQFIHRDSASLFGDFAIDVQLPTYALTVLIPMVDANARTGSTRVWPGTHRMADFELAKTKDSESPDVPFGSVMVTDSRVLHCGSPNRSDGPRPLLYNSYHRSWFRDWGGYEHRPPVNIGAFERDRLSPQYAQLFRIADESDGIPEGPPPLVERLQQSMKAPLRRAIRKVVKRERVL